MDTEQEVTHVALDRLGPEGQLYRCCDGAPMFPVSDPRTDSNEYVSLRLCPECVRVARRVGGGHR